MVFIEYPKQGIGLLVGYGRARKYLPSFKINVMELNVFLG
jgi:hypothetical protein